jgi:hypothetical protein
MAGIIALAAIPFPCSLGFRITIQWPPITTMYCILASDCGLCKSSTNNMATWYCSSTHSISIPWILSAFLMSCPLFMMVKMPYSNSDLTKSRQKLDLWTFCDDNEGIS